MNILLKKSDKSLWLLTGRDFKSALEAEKYAVTLGTRAGCVELVHLGTGQLATFHCYEIPSDWEEVKQYKKSLARTDLWQSSEHFAEILKFKAYYETPVGDSDRTEAIEERFRSLAKVRKYSEKQSLQAKKVLEARVLDALGFLPDQRTLWEQLAPLITPEHLETFEQLKNQMEVNYWNKKEPFCNYIGDYNVPKESEFINQ